MRKFLFAVLLLLGLSSVLAQAQQYTCNSGICSTSGTITAIAATTSCCYVSDDSYAAKVASWAVELQLRNWLPKKPEDLTRAEIKTARTKLEVLCKWAKEKVDNKVFSQAYLSWAGNMLRKLDAASTKLDHDEIASALLLHGLPALPEGAK